MHLVSRLLSLLLVAIAPAVAAQERIASLNLCLDQLLLEWVAPEKVVSVTWLADNDHYRRAPLPDGIHLNRGRAEELLRLDPDLVLVGQYGAGRAAARLRQLGVRVVTIPDAHSLEQLLQQLQALREVLGENPQLEAHYVMLQSLVAASTSMPASGNDGDVPTALILSANNITYGSGMLEHQLLERSGFRNLAAGQGAEQLRKMSLEEVVAAQPDLLVFYGGEREFALAHLAARHPVIQGYIQRGRVFTLPAELGFCPALVAAETMKKLAEKRTELVESQ
ncbi:ABC transporter substrate-binding protein [Microbulbifer yueqingensis]|uniref:Iron complex transport system substrate-binding protein n=1 Tax=Microbulbifer yueqingensis TaxID=658219 RepID=A0A1G8Y266_9GAMM|nr:ABC transporter substrate-binding protein [Microbulbifer yueqingensis]SDJ96544.1 iron complex transport system substrate-binding protein [Microbulbifer yueqingensis]